MLSYKDFTKYFGLYLYHGEFQTFLSNTFKDLSEYNIFDGYVISATSGIELGFTNKDAVYDDDEEVVFDKGHPLFSHFNFYERSCAVIKNLPFDVSFSDKRGNILSKAGLPTKTNKGYMNFLKRNFLIDLYKIGDIVVSFDYDTGGETVNFIQVRDNNLREDLKI